MTRDAARDALVFEAEPRPEIDGYPRGHANLLLRKRLSEPSAPR